ncbi:20265_t:CDS:2 [Cetraspora pellucida]|uniref:20265_t:CDS:1 n=1 Tax=Cetraspora pellucida TaxID=1433469 RepID=A0A9N9BJV2_9GLOM|nr:20265_t:CDS:2 [Cetraspora pellucida]
MGISLEAGRLVVILTNTLTTIVGLILIVLGLYELASPDVSLYSTAIPLATIIFGIFILLISIIGCCGGIAESKPVLWVVERILDTWWQAAYDDNPRIIRDIEDKKRPDACVNSSWFGYDRPCLDVLTLSYKHHQVAFGVWGIILAIIQVIALISAYILIVNLPTSEQRDREYRAEHERLIKIGRGGDPEQPSKPYYTDRGAGVSSGSSGATHGQYGTVP